jgi:NDP-sugar pyrophosphorylase family protein
MRRTTTRSSLADARVVLQAGGEGRRLKAVDESRTKPLLSVGGKSIIGRLLEQTVWAGFRRFTIVTGFSGGLIEQHLQAIAREFPGIQVDFFRETTPLGNAGALSQLHDDGGTTVFVFADLVTELDFAALLRIHRERQCDITLASHCEEHRISLGELITRGEYVENYLEKPTKKFLICSGVAAIEPAALSVARELALPFGISDLANAALRSQCVVTHWTHGARWLDVNTPEALQQARAILVDNT